MLEEAKIGDVIQIRPGTNDRFNGCFAVVSEVKSWGYIADVYVPTASGTQRAPIRIKKEDCAIIGSVAWLHDVWIGD